MMKYIISESQYNTIFLREEDSRKEKYRKLIQDHGFEYVSELLGGPKALLRNVFNDDIKKYYEETGLKPYKISSDGMIMYIDDFIIQSLGLNVRTFFNNEEVNLGDFRWTSGGMNYKFSAQARASVGQTNGQKLWKVAGNSGDSGFGYAFMSKKNTIGKRGRQQIFKQIIDKFGLDEISNIK
jgi:hypothetical protein